MPEPVEAVEGDADALADAPDDADGLADSEGDAGELALPLLFELPQPDRMSTIITTNARLTLQVLLIFFIPFLPDSLFVGRFGMHQ